MFESFLHWRNNELLPARVINFTGWLKKEPIELSERVHYRSHRQIYPSTGSGRTELVYQMFNTLHGYAQDGSDIDAVTCKKSEVYFSSHFTLRYVHVQSQI